MNEILIVIGLAIILLAIPLFITYKIEGNWPFNIIVSLLLVWWMLPEFNWLAFGVYLLYILMLGVVWQGKYQWETETKEERSARIRREAQAANAKRDKKLAKQPSAIKRCPNCRSYNIEHLGNNRKKFSVGKAVGGAVLTGGVGTLAGFVGKKGKDSSWHCKECGQTFKLLD